MIIRKFASLSTVERGNFQQELLKSYLRKTSNLFIYLNNSKIAENFCKKIKSDLDDQQTYIFEASPGSGTLTEQLLKHSNCNVRIFENFSKRLTQLEKFKKNFPDRLEIIDKQILDFATGNYKLLDLNREDLHKSCFTGIRMAESWGTKSCDEAECSFRLFTALSPNFAREFLSYLVYSLARFETFFESGPNEFYLFIPVSIMKTIICKPSRNLSLYTAFTIHMNTFFDYHSIDFDGAEKTKIDNHVYSVISGNNFDYTNDRTFRSKENFLAIKLRPKSIIGKMESDFLVDFVLFVKQSFMKRTNNAIRYYEKLFPGCTIELLGLGISYFKALGDLTSEEMFRIFNHVYSLPQYSNSIFKMYH